MNVIFKYNISNKVFKKKFIIIGGGYSGLNLLFNLTQKMDSYNTYQDLCSFMSKAKALKRMKDSLIENHLFFLSLEKSFFLPHIFIYLISRGPIRTSFLLFCIVFVFFAAFYY